VASFFPGHGVYMRVYMVVVCI